MPWWFTPENIAGLKPLRGKVALNDCIHCQHMHLRVHPRDDELHCYMFKTEPEFKCAQWKHLAAPVSQATSTPTTE